MAQTATNVAAASPVAATGGVLWAPEGAVLPTDATTDLDLAVFTPLGYCSEDGVQPSGEAASTEDVTAWGGDTVATLESTGAIDRTTFKLIEVLNVDVLSYVYGEGNVTITPATTTQGTQIAIADKGVTPPTGIYVFDMLTSRGTRFRRVVPVGQALLNAEDPLVHSAVGGFEVQITGLKDASGNRKYIYHALNDRAPAA